MATATTPAPSRALTPAQQKRITLRSLFDQQRPELAKLLPKGMDPDRLFRMALTECIKNPDLLDCSAESWALAIQTCAQQGLYPDSGLGYMYLVPRKNKKAGGDYVKEVSAMRGYQGDIRLARNTGEIADIYAEVVYAKDSYKVKKGLNRDIVHEPYEADDDPGPLKACYAVAKLTSGEIAFVTLTRRDVDRHRASSQGADSDYSPWKKHEAAMWKKTAIHELFKWLPKASENMERAARSIAGDAVAVDVTPVAGSTVPLEPAHGLDGLTAQLQAAGAEEGAAAQGCEHPKVTAAVLAAVPIGQLWPCETCGEALPGTKPADEAAVADSVIDADKKKAGRQGRLAE